ncbi:MAG: helix-turn-helix transcriptional regulator, partial [Lentisphaeria bacterium]|nr:helix-turn-helix transcriptional regulator [Lentisphaeria bacterium]
FNLSQSDFARLIEIDRATLNRWEHGKVRPNQSSMAKIAEFRTMGKKEFARRMAQAEEAIWK